MTHARKETRLRDRLTGTTRSLSAFLGNQAGASFVIAALTFPVLLGAAGIGVDAVLWYMDKRQNQTVADNAAVAATIAYTRDGSLSQSKLEEVVRDSAHTNNFLHGKDGTVTVNAPPASGPNAGVAGFVEVLVQQQADLYFSRMMLGNAFTIQARAVGGVSFFGEHCVVSLDPTEDGAITVTGTADVTSDCGMASNSSSDQAILVQGKATLNAQPLQAYGDIDSSGAATVTNKYPPQPLSERVDDPYAGILSGHQADPSCAGVPPKPTPYDTADSPLSPGHYCNGITINGNVDFNPGLYIVDGGNFRIQGGGDIRGEGVTFVLTAMDASDLATADFAAGTGTVDLRAPTAAEAAATGGYAGMLFIQDPYVPNLDTLSPTPKNMLTGGANVHLAGALYFPDTEVVYTGGTSGGVGCTLIVSKTVTFEGNVFLDNDEAECLKAGVTSGIQQTRVRIFE
jgi:Flp pilus assembly protein TadG